MGAALARFVQRFTANKAAETMKDWPDELRLNTAACALAPHLYAAFCEVTRGSVVAAWPTLHPAIRHVWTQRAAYAIRTIR